MAPPRRTLDRIDCEILAALQNDARRSNKELAAEVGLAPSSCLERVRRLEQDGVIRGFNVELDHKALGIGIEAMVTLRFRFASRSMYQALRAHLMAQPEVMRIYHVSGADDFLVHVAVRDTEHLHDLIVDRFTSREEVGYVSTALIFEQLRASAPNYAAPE